MSSRFGSYFDKVTDQIKIFAWFGAVAYVSFLETESVVPVFLAFTGVTFYSLRVYVKYVTIFIEVEHDVTYLEQSSREAAAINSERSDVGGIGQGFVRNLLWFMGEQRKFFLFNEAVFVFILSFALLFNVILPVLWLFAISQLYYGEDGMDIFHVDVERAFWTEVDTPADYSRLQDWTSPKKTIRRRQHPLVELTSN